MKILDKKSSSTQTIYLIDSQEEPRDASEAVQESDRENEVARKPNKIVQTVPGLNYFGDECQIEVLQKNIWDNAEAYWEGEHWWRYKSRDWWNVLKCMT